MLNIGERLKEERIRLGFNQADFAALAGVAKTSQFNYEKGERSPDAEYLAAVAEAGVDILYVVTGNRTPQATASISEAESRVLEQYRSMSPESRASVERVAAALANYKI